MSERRGEDLGPEAAAGEPAAHILADAVVRQIVAFGGSRPRSGNEQLSPDRDELGRRILANVYFDLGRGTVTLLLDEVTANYVLYAIRVLAADSAAHAREVRLAGSMMWTSLTTRNA